MESGLRGVSSAVLRAVADRLELPTDHQLIAYRTLSRYGPVVDACVLEIGGAQHCKSIRPFIDAGATTGVVTGLDHISYDQTTAGEKITILRADALRLSQAFGPSEFDFVYGLSVVEHIREPAAFLAEIFKVLRPSGLAYFEGGPIWTAPDGHHLWVATWGGAYHSRATANYLFAPYPGYTSSNPLEDWAHLLMEPVEMKEYLVTKALPEIDIACIIDWVYSNHEINRLSLAALAATYGNCDLQVLETITTRVKVPRSIRCKLWDRYGAGVDYGVRTVAYVLRKPT